MSGGGECTGENVHVLLMYLYLHRPLQIENTPKIMIASPVAKESKSDLLTYKKHSW